MPGIAAGEMVADVEQRCPGVRKLFMSGYNDDKLADRVETHSDCFLAKPFTAEALGRKVREAFDARVYA